LVMSERTSPSSRSMRFCMSSGEALEPVLEELFLRLPGEAYVHDPMSPRLMQLSHGCPRLHLSFRCLHGPHDSGTLLRLRTTLNCGSGGDWPAEEDVVDGGVGGMSPRNAQLSWRSSGVSLGV
jgi:hypothetical protein